MNSSILLVIFLVILIVVGVNGVLFLMIRGKKTFNTKSFQMLQKAAKRAQNPWESENDALKELSDLVDNLKRIEETEE